MAKVELLHNISFGANKNDIFDLLNDLDCPILVCSFDNNTITINLEDKASISFSGDSDYFRPISYIYNKASGGIGSGNYPKTPCDLKVIYADDFFYLKIESLAGWSNQKGCAFFYESLNNESYFGHSEGSNNVSLDSITLYNSNDIAYKHQKMFDYIKEIGSIDYANYDLLVSSSNTIIDDKNFIVCSTIINDSIITFNGINYYALGTNMLVELDSEE